MSASTGGRQINNIFISLVHPARRVLSSPLPCGLQQLGGWGWKKAIFHVTYYDFKEALKAGLQRIVNGELKGLKTGLNRAFAGCNPKETQQNDAEILKPVLNRHKSNGKKRF